MYSLSCTGEGNGNPLQCSCLENPRDGGAWWAAVYGVTQSWTRLKRLSCIHVRSEHQELRSLPFILMVPPFLQHYCISPSKSASSSLDRRHPEGTLATRGHNFGHYHLGTSWVWVDRDWGCQTAHNGGGTPAQWRTVLLQTSVAHPLWNSHLTSMVRITFLYWLDWATEPRKLVNCSSGCVCGWCIWDEMNIEIDGLWVKQIPLHSRRWALLNQWKALVGPPWARRKFYQQMAFGFEHQILPESPAFVLACRCGTC